jgi:hypothetical protein
MALAWDTEVAVDLGRVFCLPTRRLIVPRFSIVVDGIRSLHQWLLFLSGGWSIFYGVDIFPIYAQVDWSQR